MFVLRTFAFTVILIIGTNARGIGKAWEVSPNQSSEHSPLSSRPRLESSAFEIRSVSGIGRLVPSSTQHEKVPSNFPIEEISIKEIPSNVDREKSEETSGESSTESRVAKELDDLEPTINYHPEVESADPNEEVEFLPNMWRKFRRGRKVRTHDVHCTGVEETREPDSEEISVELSEEKPRLRREAEPEMEKIAASKSVREGRLGGSSESWSTQPLSVEFRHRTKPEDPEEEEKLSRSRARGFQAPHVDFVTSNRRSFSENRESRDMSLPSASSRSYDAAPIYQDPLRNRDLDSNYNRRLFYPERYRTERDYFVRGSNEANYQQDRYRDAELDLYGRNRPMPKPKRIIYYAALPEIVREPVVLRGHQRPYDVSTRSSGTSSDDYHFRRNLAANEPSRYRYYSYPYGNYDPINYDPFAKRSAWNERLSYEERMSDPRRREQDLDHASLKDNSKDEESMLELGHERKIPERTKLRDQEQLPWPVHIGTEVSVKDNNRITGRKIFAQRDDYNRFRHNVDRNRELSASTESRV